MKKTALDYAKWICDTLMKIPAEMLPPEGEFHYHQGVALMGIQKTYELCKDIRYYNYAKRWVDSVTYENGKPKQYDKEKADDLMAGMLLYMIYDKEHDRRYKNTLDLLVSHPETWPKNEKGGFWHKDIYPNQMWLDGIFMYGPLISEYAARFGTDRYFDTVYEQLCLMWDNMRDKNTGLLRHAWDCSVRAQWAEKETGLSPESWGRAIGWYVAALMDIYEIFPGKYRADILDKELKLIDALIKYQNPESGMWYQVVDKLDRQDNWPEVSCTCLFVYGICKAFNLGLIDSAYMEYAIRGYEGVISMLETDNEGGLLVGHVCIGTGVGNYDFYIERPTKNNDLHGIGAFLYMTTEMEKAQEKLKEAGLERVGAGFRARMLNRPDGRCGADCFSEFMEGDVSL